MRKTFILAYQNIQNLNQHRDILALQPISPQQSFLQTLGNIILCHQKQSIGDIMSLLRNYRGSFSHLVLTLKYCTYCMEKQLNQNFHYFTILKMLTKWVQTLESLKKKKDVRLYTEVIQNLQLGICQYEEFIVYLNYISTDLTTIIKSGTDETKKKYSDLTHHPHLDSHDLIKFLNAILPKVLTNLIVPRSFFPNTLLKVNDQNVDILYSNQTLQNIAQNKSHYNLLLRAIIKILISMDLQPNQTKQLVLNSFKYYYLYHHDKNCSASQFVIESLKKITSAVRFAISDQISLFLVMLKKLGKQLFISYLIQKFQWTTQLMKANTIYGIDKSTIKPYYNQGLGNSFKLRVQARKTETYFLQIYDPHSLLYFSINCPQNDINIRFYYIGNFNKQQGRQQKRLLFSSQKKQGIFEGSIQVIDKGIYMFQFDNSYSWVKGKILYFDTTILVPLQIKQQSTDMIKKILFEKYQNLNEVPYENVSGWIDQQQVKNNSTNVNITCLLQQNIKVYNLKLIAYTGQTFQYETESKQRFINKLKKFEKEKSIYWFVQGYKVRNINQIQKWINGQFQPEKLTTSQEDERMMKQQFQRQQKLQSVRTQQALQKPQSIKAVEEENLKVQPKIQRTQQENKNQQESKEEKTTKENQQIENTNSKLQEQTQIKQIKSEQKIDKEQNLQNLQSEKVQQKEEK